MTKKNFHGGSLRFTPAKLTVGGVLLFVAEPVRQKSYHTFQMPTYPKTTTLAAYTLEMQDMVVMVTMAKASEVTTVSVFSSKEFHPLWEGLINLQLM